MNSNALINASGDFCTACGHPFVRNFVGFDTLPLVEFVPRSDIPLKKVMDFLKMDPPEDPIVAQNKVSPPKRKQ